MKHQIRNASPSPSLESPLHLWYPAPKPSWESLCYLGGSLIVPEALRVTLHLNVPPAFLMSSEPQPRGLGKAHKPNCSKLPADCSSLLLVIKASEALKVCLQAHLTNAAVTSAVCRWQVPVSTSCPTAMRRISFPLQGSCQAQHQHQQKEFSGFSLFNTL